MVKIEGYLRVTEVLSPFSGLHLIPKNILEAAGERGIKVHEHCDAIMKNLCPFGIDDKASGYTQSFQNWAIDKKFIDKPGRLYCDKYKITGEIDGIYQDKDGSLVLIDIKTPQNEGVTWRYQGSAYSYLCRNIGINISRIEFIKVDKDGKDCKIFQYQEDFDGFLDDKKIFDKYFKKMKRDELVANYCQALI